MLLHYLKTALRNIYKNKAYSCINILGLAMGIAATLLLAKHIGFALTFDNFHLNKDRIFLVEQEEWQDGSPQSRQASTYWGVAKMANDLYPEIQSTSHFSNNVEMLVTRVTKEGKSTSFNERRICTVDSSFLSIFTFAAIAGSTADALTTRDAIVLTRSAAKRYFGDTDPIGQLLTTRVSWGEETTYKVTCVVEDTPDNSTLQFDFLISAGIGPVSKDQWNNASYKTYLLMNDDDIDTRDFSRKLSADIGRHPLITSQDRTIDFSLKGLSDTSLTPNAKILSMTGIFILVISWINFINLSIGSAQARTKETGVRKVIGATRKQVIAQFVFECILINGVSLFFALLFFALARPMLEEFSNDRILPIFGDPTPLNGLFFVVFLIGTIASSAYPALIMSSSKPINLLKGKSNQGRYVLSFRKALVIIQFTISIVAAIGVFIVSDQLNFFLDHDLKIKLDHTLVIKSPKDLWDGKIERLNSFKHEALDLAMVQNAASGTTTPGENYKHEVNFGITASDKRYLFYLNDVDHNFLDLYGIEFLAGANYNPDTPGKNRNGIILNKTAANTLGFIDVENALGKSVTEDEDGNAYEIIGIVNDYHQMSLKYQIKPQAFRFNNSRGDISIKMHASNYAKFDDLQNCIAELKNLWERIYPDQSFQYQFMDTEFNDQYQAEFNFRRLFAWFTGMSLIIACLGLFGLSLFISIKRRKEVGVRKVFGASSFAILVLFTRDYLMQMLIAITIGTPLAYFIMKTWLESFSFRTTINISSFVIPCVCLFTVSLLTTACQTVRAAFANPTKTLSEQ